MSLGYAGLINYVHQRFIVCLIWIGARVLCLNKRDIFFFKFIEILLQTPLAGANREELKPDQCAAQYQANAKPYYTYKPNWRSYGYIKGP